MARSAANDAFWYKLIELALFHRARIGKFHNIRFERQSFYILTVLPVLASILVDSGVIIAWPAGYRRLRSIEDGASKDFFKVWGKYPSDQ